MEQTDSMASTAAESGERAGPSGPTAVSIVGFRNAGDIAQCLVALQDSLDPDFLVLVCENGGRPAYDELIRILAATLDADNDGSLPPTGSIVAVWRGRLRGGQLVEVLCASDNLGYAGGVNATLHRLDVHPRWSALWVLNPDTQPEPNALAALVAKAASDPAYGIIGSRLVLAESGTIQAYGGRWRPMTGRGFNIGLHQPAKAVPDVAAVEREMTYVLGASMYVTRAFIEAVGPMHEDYFLYVEEVDWCYRRGHFKLGFAEHSVINHLHGGSLGSSTKRRHRSRLSVYLDERNRHLFSRRFFPALYPIIAISTLVFTAQYVRALAPRNFAAALQGWWAGLRGETGKPAWMR